MGCYSLAQGNHIQGMFGEQGLHSPPSLLEMLVFPTKRC